MSNETVWWHLSHNFSFAWSPRPFSAFHLWHRCIFLPSMTNEMAQAIHEESSLTSSLWCFLSMPCLYSCLVLFIFSSLRRMCPQKSMKLLWPTFICCNLFTFFAYWDWLAYFKLIFEWEKLLYFWLPHWLNYAISVSFLHIELH